MSRVLTLATLVVSSGNYDFRHALQEAAVGLSPAETGGCLSSMGAGPLPASKAATIIACVVDLLAAEAQKAGDAGKDGAGEFASALEKIQRFQRVAGAVSNRLYEESVTTNGPISSDDLDAGPTAVPTVPRVLGLKASDAQACRLRAANAVATALREGEPGPQATYEGVTTVDQRPAVKPPTAGLRLGFGYFNLR
jgi:hypothetical protein